MIRRGRRSTPWGACLSCGVRACSAWYILMYYFVAEEVFLAAFKCYRNYHKIDPISSDNLYYKMVIHGIKYSTLCLVHMYLWRMAYVSYVSPSSGATPLHWNLFHGLHHAVDVWCICCVDITISQSATYIDCCKF